MDTLRQQLAERGVVLFKRLQAVLTQSELEKLAKHPPQPYIALSYDETFTPQLQLNAGVPFAFLTADADVKDLKAALAMAVASDALLDSAYYNKKGQSQAHLPEQAQARIPEQAQARVQEQEQPAEIAVEPPQKPDLEAEKYQVKTETRITSTGQLGSVKVEKKLKSGSIMGFLKKK